MRNQHYASRLDFVQVQHFVSMPTTVTPDTLLAFKAGRAFRTGDTNTVVADPAKGAILLTNGEDGLLHFIWKDRNTNSIEEVHCADFILTLAVLILFL